MESKENIKFTYQYNNKKRSANVFVLFIASGVLFLGAAFYFLATNMNILLMADVVAGIVWFVLFTNLKPSFFEILVSESGFQVNYYSVASTMRNYQSIEIEFSQFAGFEVGRKMKGLKHELILSVNSKYGVADYPPVSMTLVTKKERKQVVSVLQQIINQKYQFEHK
ncbi:MAG: hypothetical protein JW798_05460 [Prolixibacteraceae bacterium]|nr:hypothetical protein [Prolixibacteraceae bacterium]